MELSFKYLTINMVVKEFLYDKIIHFNIDTVNEFQQRMVDPLPSYNKPDMKTAFIWGSNEHGHWTVNAYEGRFFEPNGNIHIVGWLRGYDYYTTYCDIYNCSGVRLSKPCSIEQGQLQITGHPNGMTMQDKVYHIKLQTPTKQYGRTLQLEKLLNPTFDIKSHAYQYINDMTRILTVCRDFNGLAPDVMESNSRLIDDEGIVYTVFPRFTVSLRTSIKRHLAYLTPTFLIEMSDIDRNEIFEYAKNQWHPLVI